MVIGRLLLGNFAVFGKFAFTIAAENRHFLLKTFKFEANPING